MKEPRADLQSRPTVRSCRAQVGGALIVFLLLLGGPAARAATPSSVTLTGDIVGTVKDSSTGQPLPSAEVSAMQESRVVANTQTDAFGRFRIHNLPVGTYQVAVRYLGFRAMSRPVIIGAQGGDVTGVDMRLVPAALNLSAFAVSAAAPIALDTRTGDQVFKQNDYHGAPTNTTSQILQESIAGAARAPTGEVHIRGQHAEYTYYVDGVPVPAGISGSLNELFDPEVVNNIAFQTGGWDAEYGNKNAAVVNVTTKIPSGGFHMDLGSYVGRYDNTSTVGAKTFNGQSLSLSTNAGKWGAFFSGARQSSDMRREPIVFDTAASRVENFHNNGNDYFGFGKVQYTPGSNNVVNLDLNLSRTHFQVPYDSSANTFADDRQTDVNSFVNLGWRHQFDAAGKGGLVPELFGALFYRHGSLSFVPSPRDSAQFVFFPDTTAYNLSEQRNFDTYGVKLDYLLHPTTAMEVKVGTISSITRGREDFNAIASNGSSGPSSNSTLRGSDVGVYAQTAISPVEWFELRTGVRYDAHTAPFAGTKTQVSPRIRLNFFPSPATTLYAYYGRLFLPTNVEDLRAITSSALGDQVSPLPTLPERDNFYELGLVQRFPAGVSLKLSGYRKESSPGIDDNTVPGSAIVTSVNIDRVWITGIESVLEFRPGGSFSGYANVALNHAYGRGPITGGFFPTDTPDGYFDLDHDQRLSAVASATYSINRFFLSGTGIYGSGLTNGVDPADCECSYGTGLFDFNKGIKVAPSTIFNASLGYTFIAGSAVVRPQLYIENAFNKEYLLKGAFFSGASVGRPRSIQLRVNVGV